MSRNIYRTLAIVGLGLSIAPTARAQAAPPAGFQFQWSASAPDTCLGPAAGWTKGYQESPSWTFFTENNNIPLSGIGDFYQDSWTLSDTSGQLATGSYNSTTGQSTGGTGAGGATFSITRIPVGDLLFTSNVSYYTHSGQNGPCGASYQEVANARTNSEWIAITGSHIYAFESEETGFALEMPNSSLGTQLIQANYTGASDQQWTLDEWDGVVYYYFVSVSTGKSLYYDGTYNGSIVNPHVVQEAAAPYPSCSSSAWHFTSVGDGSYYIVGTSDGGSGSECGALFFTETYYAMTDESTGSGTGIEASSLVDSPSQKWKVIVIK